jgi:integrase
VEGEFVSAKLLTDRFVANAKPRRDAAGKAIRAEYSDAACPGLRLLVQPTGSKSWALRYRRPDGRTAKKTFPGTLTLAAARAAASAARLEIERGTDPAPQRLPITAYSSGDGEAIEVVAADFLEKHGRKIRPKTLEQYESILRNYVLPAWRGRSIGDIRRRDAIDLIERIAADYPTLANRTITTGSKFYAWMIARDMVDANPFNGVERPHKELPRQNVIPADALRALWIAGGELGAIGAALRMLILTGCRLQEVSRMTWDEVDLASRLWTIPGSRTKNHKTHIVPLSAQAIEVVQALPCSCEFVFTADGRRPVRGWASSKERISKRAGIDVNSWRLHDLRRTAASGMQKLGTPVHVIERALNHVSGVFRGVAGTYQVDELRDEVTNALRKWGDHVTRLAGGKPAEVVKLHTRR